MKKITYLSAIIACFFLFIGTNAQELRTAYFMQTSLYRHQINPALLDSAYISMPFLGNIDLGMTGNMGLKTFIYKSHHSEYDLTTFMSPEVGSEEFYHKLHNKNRLDVYANYGIYSEAFKHWGGTNLVEINLRSNSHVSVPKELLMFAKDAGARDHYEFSNIGLNSQSYLEIAFGHARNIGKKWRVGGKMKILLGMAYADMDVKHMNLTLGNDKWIVNSDAQLTAAVLKSSWKYDTDTAPATTQPGRKKINGIDMNGFNMPGFGMAFDAGATYQPIKELKLSASVTDLGFLHWSKALRASSKGEYTFDGFNDVWLSGPTTETATGGKHSTNKIQDQSKRLGDDMNRLFSLYEEESKTHSHMLAATLNFGMEYTMKCYDRWRWGFLYTGRVQGIYSWHQGMFSTMVRPLNWLELCLNTSFSSTGPRWGGMCSFYVKKFNFFIASDRFVGKLGKQYIPLNKASASISMGLNFPL